MTQTPIPRGGRSHPSTLLSEITPRRKKQHRPRGYIEHYKPNAATRTLLEHVDAVLREYGDHLPLSIRQIFYRLVAAYLYEKTERFYKNLCGHLVNARRGRRIPFSSIRDDGVVVIEAGHYTDEDAFRAHVHALARNYRRDKLARQPSHIEVWCEAAGMLPQLARVAGRYSIDVYSCSGFDSLPAKRQIVDRIVNGFKPGVILHLGDYDPSGDSMFEAVAQDVDAFVRSDRYDARQTVRFKRVGLTPEQVTHYTLPTAPAKTSDSRAKNWAERRGSDATCQLEALPPNVIAELLETAIQEELDLQQLAADFAEEKIERQRVAYLLSPGGAA